MLKKTIAVLFDDASGAKIIVNPDNPEELRKDPKYLIDPDLREVRGIPTCFWKNDNGKVRIMTPSEMEFVSSNFKIQTKPMSQKEKAELRKNFLSKKLFVQFLAKEKSNLTQTLDKNAEFVTDQMLALSQTLTKHLEEEAKESKKFRLACREEYKTQLSENLFQTTEAIKITKADLFQHLHDLREATQENITQAIMTLDGKINEYFLMEREATAHNIDQAVDQLEEYLEALDSKHDLKLIELEEKVLGRIDLKIDLLETKLSERIEKKVLIFSVILGTLIIGGYLVALFH